MKFYQTLRLSLKVESNFRVYIRPTSAAQSMNNPSYRFNAVLESHTPMSGAVGEILMTSVPFRSAGGSLERLVTTT